MMLVDDRTGSGDLVPHLKRLGVRAELCRLEFGDVAFVGNGPSGSVVHTGVEVKTVTDVLNCINDGRFAAHQLPGLLQTYDQVWLLVEGRWRPSQEGLLELYRKGFWGRSFQNRTTPFMYKTLDSWLMTMEIKAGIRYRKVDDRAEAVRFLACLYHWWTSKEYDQHRAHLALRNNVPAAQFRKPSLIRNIAAQLPGVGWDRSKACEQHFDSVRQMICAGPQDWAKVPGIGKTIAKRLYDALSGK